METGGTQPDQEAVSGSLPSKPNPARGFVSMVAGVASILSLGVGVLIGYLLFNDASPADGADVQAVDGSAEADLGAACRIAERLSESHGTEEDWGSISEDTAYWEAPALGFLFVSAAYKDARYERLEDLGLDINRGVTRMALEDLITSIGEAANECRQLAP